MSVDEWLRSLNSNHLPLNALDSNPDMDFKFFHVRKPAYGTSVVLLRCPFVPEIMHERAPEFFAHQLSWNITL
jgi:hypothetical protein